MINLDKLDKFYFALAGIVIAFIGLAIFIAKNISSAFVIAYGDDSSKYQTDLKIDQKTLDNVYDKIFNNTNAQN
jgi:hypothetical protein